MMIRAVFDTTVLIDHLRGRPAALKLIKEVESGAIFGSISALTIAELFSGADSGTAKRRDDILKLTGLFERVPVDEVLAEKAGAIRRESGVEMPDAVISAVALASDSVLYTSNIKDFRKVPNLSVKEPY